MADYAQSPYAGIEHCKSVVERLGQASVTDFMRLYVTPGQTIWASARHPASTYSKCSSRRSKEERRQAISYNSIKLRNRHSQCSRRVHVPLSGLPSLCRRGCHQEGELRLQNAVGHSRTARLSRRADAAIEFAWTRWRICSRGRLAKDVPAEAGDQRLRQGMPSASAANDQLREASFRGIRPAAIARRSEGRRRILPAGG
jgi:hypothetical protein